MKYSNKLADIHCALKDDYLRHYAFVEKIRKKDFSREIEVVKNILKDGINKDVFVIYDINRRRCCIKYYFINKKLYRD